MSSYTMFLRWSGPSSKRTFIDYSLVDLLLVADIGRLLLKRDNWSTAFTHMYAYIGGVNWLNISTRPH
jgi:hypothetical protein